MKLGTVTRWDAVKGFGFITDDEGEEYFVHVSDLAVSLDARKVSEGLRVKFDVKSDMKGDKAVNVRRA